MADNNEMDTGFQPESENDKTKRIELPADGQASEYETEAVPEAVDENISEGIEAGQTDESAEEENAVDSGDGDYSAAEGTDAQLLSEFAPKPIKIPNVDLKKEKKKQDKRRKNRGKEAKKVEARKNKGRRRRSTGQKVAIGVAGFLLFLLLSVSMTGFISVLATQTATSEYAFRLSVRNMDVSEIALGGIENPDLLGLDRSSSAAALIDIIRDNSDNVITYQEINSGLRSSGLEAFLAGRMKAASDYLLKGKSYQNLTGNEIADVIRQSSTLVNNLTGRALTAEDYTTIAAYFNEYGSLSDVSQAALDETRLHRYTNITRHLTSLPILGALLLVSIVLIILMCIICRENTYLPLGWSFIVSGIAVVLAAIFFRPSFSVGTAFLQTVLNKYFAFFTTAIIVIAGVFTVVGAFIFLIGNASSDHDED